jgi:nicotinamidase-related amidase
MHATPPRRPALDVGAAPAPLPRSPCVLLLVDFINPLRFEGAQALAEAAWPAAQAAARLKRRLARAGVPAIYANDNYGVWRSDFRQLLAACKRLPGTPGRIARMLAPAPADLALLKPRHSAFYATPLDLLLTQMHARRLVVVGLATDICVQVTATDAHLRGFQVWVPPDCSAAESPRRAQHALHHLAEVFGTRTEPSDTVAGVWPRGAARRLPRQTQPD